MERAWFRNGLAPVAVGIVILVLWQAFCALRQIPVYLFPALTDIAASLPRTFPCCCG